MRKYSPILFFILIFISNTKLNAQDGYKRNESIDILHYIFDLSLSDQNNEITGSASLRFHLKSQQKQIILDLQNKSENGGMNISNVFIDDEEAKYSHDSNLVTVALNGKTPGIHTIIIDYQGQPTDGLIIGTNKYGDRTFFGDNWPNRAHHWLPCVDHPSDKATIEFKVKAPAHYMVIANGTKKEESFIDDNTKITHWSQESPIPMKVAVIGAARFATFTNGIYDGIEISSWVYPQNRLEGFEDYHYAVEILRYFDENIGEYPFSKLANVQSKTRYGGMENASNIFYFENSVTGNKDHEPLIAHEIAHQWFGNSATEKNWHHLWLSEGFATYFTHLYMEDKYGKKSRQSRMQEDRDKIIDFAHTRFTPIIDSTEYDYMSLLNANSYQKGSWFLHMLRNEIGNDQFWEVIREYYELYRDSNAQTQDFQNVVEKVNGMKMDTFFDQWLKTPGHPQLKVKWKYSASKKAVILDVQQTQDYIFNFNLEVKISGDHLEKININKQKQKFEIPVDQKPQNIIYDPNVNLLFELK